MAVSCERNNSLALNDYNGNYLNVSLQTTSSVYVTGVDSSERLVLISSQSLDIFIKILFKTIRFISTIKSNFDLKSYSAHSVGHTLD